MSSFGSLCIRAVILLSILFVGAMLPKDFRVLGINIIVDSKLKLT